MPIKTKGLNGYQLKIIAATLMVLDHIYFFYVNIYKVPTFFTQLGRLSAPIFLFLLVEGFFHTRNKIKYFLRIYILAAIMGVVRIILRILSQGVNGLPPFPNNGMLSTFTVLLAAMIGFEMLKKQQLKQKILGGFICFMVLLLPYAMMLLLNIPFANALMFFLKETVFPLHPFVNDGGTLFVVCGLALYFFYGSLIKQAFAYVVVSVGYYFYLLLSLDIPLTPQNLLHPYNQWLMAFAVVFFLLYNGQRGKGIKWFFYVFYPAHIYLLYGVAVILYLNH